MRLLNLAESLGQEPVLLKVVGCGVWLRHDLEGFKRRLKALETADLLNNRVLPFLEGGNVPLLRVRTDRGTEYSGAQGNRPPTTVFRSRSFFPTLR